MKALYSVDGQPDLAKTAALIAHFLMACAFARLQVFTFAPFIAEIWLTYGGFALLHDGYNRATAMLKDRSDRKIAAETPAPPLQPSTVTTVTTVETP
jgi:hypothetical protein